MFKNEFMKVQRSFQKILAGVEIIIAVSICNPLHSQEKTSEFSGFTIPPLGQLIESALENSPLLDEQKAVIAIREWQLKSAQNEWSRYILFFTEMRYGSIDILISNGGSVTYGDKSNTARYNVGARLQLSAFDLFDQKRKNKIAREQINLEGYKKKELERMIKDDVIRLWNKLVAYKEIVSINEDHIVVQDGNFFYAEQQFRAGDIPLGEYARIKEISIKANQEYQLAKKEFRETYLLLESLAGTKLTELNTNRQ